jgi:hypothetical protein
MYNRDHEGSTEYGAWEAGDAHHEATRDYGGCGSSVMNYSNSKRMGRSILSPNRWNHR